MVTAHSILQDFLDNETNVIALRNSTFRNPSDHCDSHVNFLNNLAVFRNRLSFVAFHYFLIEQNYFPYINFIIWTFVRLNKMTWVEYDEDVLHEYVKKTFDEIPQRFGGFFGKNQTEIMRRFVFRCSNPFSDNDHQYTLLNYFHRSIENNHYAVHVFNCRNGTYVELCIAQWLLRKSRVAMIYDELQTECMDKPCLLADEYIAKTIVKFL